MAGRPILLDLSSNNIIQFGDATEFTIGRSIHSSLDIPSPFISRNQCIIRINSVENQFTLTDLSSFRTTTVNNEPIKGEYCVLNDGDKIAFLNYKDREFRFFSDADKLLNGSKKRKLSDIVDDSILSPANQESKHRKEKLLDRCNTLEKENQRLSDRLRYLTVLSENTQKSLTLLETENKTLRDRLQEEEHAKELMLIKIRDLEDSLKESENERERIQLENFKTNAQTSSGSDERIVVRDDFVAVACSEIDLNDVMVEADYFHNFDYSISAPPTPKEITLIEEPNDEPIEVDDSSPREITDHTNLLEAEKKKQDNSIYGIPNDLNLQNIVDQVEVVFIEAENAALTRELEKKDLLVTATICEKETFRTNILEALEHELLCSVCSEILYQPLTLNCKHTFCKTCVTEWKKKKKECPVCRTKIKVEIPTIVLDSFIDKAAEVLGEEFKARRDEVKDERKTTKKISPKGSARKKGRRARNDFFGLLTVPTSVSGPVELIDIASYQESLQRRTVEAMIAEVVDLTSSPRASSSRRRRVN